VLIYILLAEHRIEVIADRGIAEKVGKDAWIGLCARLRDSFVMKRFGDGLNAGVVEPMRCYPSIFRTTAALGSTSFRICRSFSEKPPACLPP
jgi:hypothetical protein